MPHRARHNPALAPLAAVLLLFLLRVGVAMSSVPPWQNPDEPQHVMAVWARMNPAPSPAAVIAMEREVIGSLARHRWWERVGARQPSALPGSLAEDPELVRRHVMLPRSDGLYYGTVAALTRRADPEGILWSARTVSVVAALLTLVLAFGFGRALLGPWAGLGMVSILALHPQYALVATSASGDAFVGLLSAGVLWSAAEALQSPKAPWWLAAVIAFAGAAVLSRRLGLTVALVAAWALVVSVSARRLREAVWLGGAAVLTLGIVGAGLFAVGAGTLLQTAGELLDLAGQGQAAVDPWVGVAGLVKSSWLTAGWLTSAHGSSWRPLFVGLTVCALLAPALAWLRGHPAQRRAAVLAGGAVALQVGALLARQAVVGEMSQGRYLAPVALALALLLWVGILEATPRRWQPVAAAALVALMAVIDAAGWAQVVIPAFS